MSRYPLRCQGCSGEIVARLGAQPTRGTKFYFPCPHCGISVRGHVRGQDLFDHTVEFDCERVGSEELFSDPLVVTTNPFVPSKYSAERLDEFGGSGTFVLEALLGSGAPEYFFEEGQAQQLIEEQWLAVRRFFEYYLSENWNAFDRAGGELYSNWERVHTTHERASRAHDALGQASMTVLGRPSQGGDRFFERLMRKHSAALDHPTYVSFFRSEAQVEQIRELQRALFETIELFIARSESWAAGRLVRRMAPSGASEVESLVLYRDEFGETRDLYQRGFEVVCKTLRYLVAAQNAVKRQDPEDFGQVHPSDVPPKSRPTSIAGFDRLSNYYRLEYVRAVPGWEGFAALLDSRLRNSIGHATVRHDLRTGRVVSDKDPLGVPYLVFVSRVFDVFEALTFSVHILRFARTTSSPDFATREVN